MFLDVVWVCCELHFKCFVAPTQAVEAKPCFVAIRRHPALRFRKKSAPHRHDRHY
jgi:hypothetical protein